MKKDFKYKTWQFWSFSGTSVSERFYIFSCFDRRRRNHLIKHLLTTPCYVSQRDTLASGNDMPETNCHLIGCLLSHNGCLLSSPFTAGFGSVTIIIHLSFTSVWLHFLSQILKKFCVWLSFSVTLNGGLLAPERANINLAASSLWKTAES